ncbi:MAG: ribonuclease HII [Alphaproteobacteria bacterium]|nr:ribonuclease HII [Alphaproteobacteria bacterium]
MRGKAKSGPPPAMGDLFPHLLTPAFLKRRALIEDVVGIDEAGRGPLAGPVVAAAVILRPRAIPEGLGDSKVIPAAERVRLYDLLVDQAEVAVGIATVEEIDRHNILAATFLAMQRAVANLRSSPRLAIVDGNRAPALPCPVTPLVKGDALHRSVSAASIVAKVTRDRLMRLLSEDAPHYGFERNMGYGTREHLAALDRFGPCVHHRRSFRPVRNCAPLARTAANANAPRPVQAALGLAIPAE